MPENFDVRLPRRQPRRLDREIDPLDIGAVDAAHRVPWSQLR